MEILIVAAALLVAFSNGANDNLKGFATVWGSDTLSYRQALTLATVATIAGSLASLMLADTLVEGLSGKGLVPEVVVTTPFFMLSVAGGAAVTVLLATRLGLPISTTHALIGGLIGAGLGVPEGLVNWAPLANSFLAPMLVSPLLAAALSMLAHRLVGARVRQKDCACIVVHSLDAQLTGDGTVVRQLSMPSIVVDSPAACDQVDAAVKISVSRTQDRLHVLSAMSICFARSVNDTPKLTALLLAAHVLGMRLAVGTIAVAMVIGGLLLARRVAQTMSKRVSRLGHHEGLVANVVTALVVLFASKLGFPVSTTHVAVGAIAGVGASAQSLNWQTLRNVLLSWVATLPLAAGAAFVITRIAYG